MLCCRHVWLGFCAILRQWGAHKTTLGAQGCKDGGSDNLLNVLKCVLDVEGVGDKVGEAHQGVGGAADGWGLLLG